MSTNARVYYNKLVRDEIPTIIAAKGEACGVREITDDQEFTQELLKKVREEAQSLSMATTTQDFLEEYADLMMVLETLTDRLAISDATIEEVRQQNRTRKGGYQKRNFLEWSEDGTYHSNESPQGIRTS